MSVFRSRIIGSGTESPGAILANPGNWREHPEEQERALEGLLTDVGWVQQVIINRTTGHLIDGHLRVSLAKRRGEKSIPVIYVELSEDEERLVLATIDPIGGLATTNQDALDAILEGLSSEQDGLQALLDMLAQTEDDEPVEGLTDEDDTPAPRPDPITKPGCVWVMGDHRLLCADSTDPDAVAYVAQDLVDMVWTDPPYNVAYEGATKDRLTIMNDAMDGDRFRTFLTEAFTAALQASRDGAPIYVAHAETEGINFRAALTDAGWLHKQTLVWVKNALVLGRQDYQWQHEPILYGWKPGAGHSWYGERDKTTVIREDKPSRNDVHPTMKPVALIEHMLLNSSQPGDVVLDSFGGSGSTLIACHKHRRKARLLELDPVYCDVIVRRWQEHTGQTAHDEKTGRPFPAQTRLAA